MPLYLVAMLLMFALVGFATEWTLQVSLWDLVRSLCQWLIFTVKGNPDINGLKNTFTVISGVTWSLPYEWMFYFALPALGLLLGVPASNKVKIYAGIFLVATLVLSKPEAAVLSGFLGGMVAAALVRMGAIRKFASSAMSGVLIVGALGYLLTFYATAYTIPSMLLLTFVFVLISAGNTLFGVFTSQISRTLGEMGYGIYLLHGLFLFLFFRLLIGVEASAQLSELQHWAVVGCLTPVLISFAFVTYKWIERPSINSTDRVLVWFRLLDRR